QSIYAAVPFDLRKDFVPLSQTVWSYNVLVVHPSVRAQSVQELAGLMKSQPGKLTFPSGGPGTPAHIAGELFKQQTGTQALHVPYNQFPQAIADLLGGQHQFMFAATPPMIPHIAAGKLRALAVTGSSRIAALKDVPTMVEAGFPDFVVRDWQGVVARAGTPTEVVQKVNGAIRRAMQSQEVRAVLAKLGADAAAGTPEEFARLIDLEIGRWAKVAKAANIRVE
ncbi:MAG TPA: tripartite tricarboxylate transporter substrate-binding protein, partial [Burkholderiales bacterium]|nr:tripartite tricarboxylate transporter substrate-binding protein [Burkholderiales bacterium]